MGRAARTWVVVAGIAVVVFAGCWLARDEAERSAPSTTAQLAGVPQSVGTLASESSAIRRAAADAELVPIAAGARAPADAGTAHLDITVERGAKGARVAGVWVEARPSEAPGTSQRARAGEDGTLGFDLAPDIVWILIVAPDSVARTAALIWHVGPYAANARATETLSLPVGAIVAGRVVDETGRPVADAHVFEVSRLTELNPVETTTDARGAFELGPLPSRFTISADAVGYASRYSATGTCGVDGRVDDVCLVLSKARRVVGRVTCEARPIGGATIEFSGRESRDVGDFWLVSAPSREVTTDADGTFVVDAFASRSVLVTVAAKGAVPFQREIVISGAPLEIALERAVAFDLRVVDADGAPIERCDVSVESEVDIAEADELRTDATGTARIEGTPLNEPISLWLRADGFLAGGKEEFVPADGSVVSIALDRAAPLRGRVVDRNGAPVKSASVYVHSIEAGQPSSNWISHADVNDTDGSFVVNDLPSGTYSLVAWTFSGWRQFSEPVVATTGGEATLVLDARAKPTTTLRGFVRDAITGRPIERFQHCVYVDNSGAVVRGEGGAFAVDLVPIATSVWFTVVAEGYDRWKSEPRLFSSQLEEFDIRLWPLRDATVCVTSPDGAAFPLAVVAAWDDDTASVHADHANGSRVDSALVGANGCAKLRNVPARPLRFEVSAWPGGPSTSHVVDCTPSPLEPIMFTLRAPPHAVHRVRVPLRVAQDDTAVPDEVVIHVEANGVRIASASIVSIEGRFAWTSAGRSEFVDEPVVPLVLPLIDLRLQIYAAGFDPAIVAVSAARQSGAESIIELVPTVNQDD